MIIGITGPIGAGKSTVAKYLTEKGFTHHSVRAFLAEELQRRNEPLSRAALVAVGNQLRQTHGSSYVMDTVIQNALAVSEQVVVESVRAVGDAQAVRSAGGVVLAIDAEPMTRYERLVERGGVTVPASFEDFLRQDAREQQSDDPSLQSINTLVAEADHVIHNNGDQEALFCAVDEFVSTFSTTPLC